MITLKLLLYSYSITGMIPLAQTQQGEDVQYKSTEMHAELSLLKLPD